MRSTPRWRNVAGARRVGRPVVVPALIAVNVVVFALTVVAAGSLNRNDASALFQYGSLVPGLVTDGEWWRLITSGFLHFGPIHLLFNMFALFVIGREVEGVLGRARLITVYAVSLLGGSAAVMLFSSPASQTAGASGAVFGVMAALAVLALRLRVPARQAFGLIALNIVISIVVPGISLVGHLGGLVAGAATTAALVYTPARNGPGLQIAAVSGVVVVLLALIGVSVV
ncbi:rhomboid family intramembrane serine protease [Pseudonocardia endophytica]|uniref:rhomboid family intramembrane serine protease n=1 Tax=Pseudonocardia endophytica TaxID=401976 RepID=UPI001FB545DC|nr:rhomboid family intramembrane serine protease [Pseudonocardia endophytica]